MKRKSVKTAVEKALDLIEALKDNDHLGVTELSKILKLNKNNVFRLLATLELKGLVEQDEETGHYKLGMKFLYLEDAYLKSLPFLKLTKPFMRRLKNEIGESVYLSVLHKDDIVYMYSEETNKPVHVHSRIARRYSSETTASGRALKKAENEGGYPIEIDNQETEPEVIEIATIIKDEWEHPIASISILAPVSRLDKDKVENIKKLLLKTAKDITEEIKRKNQSQINIV